MTRTRAWRAALAAGVVCAFVRGGNANAAVSLTVTGQTSGNVSAPYVYPNVTFVNASAVSNVPANCTVSVNGGGFAAAAGQGTTTNYVTFGNGSSPLAAGSYTAAFQCTATGDDNGTGTAPTTVSFTVATPGVALTLSAQTSGNVSAPYVYPNVTFVNASAVSNVPANCTVSINGAAAVAASGQGTTTNYHTFINGTLPLPAGTYTTVFQCTATGADNGTGSAPTTVSFTVQPAPLGSISFSATPPGPFYLGDAQMTITATLSGVTTPVDHVAFDVSGAVANVPCFGSTSSCNLPFGIQSPGTTSVTGTAYDSSNVALTGTSSPVTIVVNSCTANSQCATGESCVSGTCKIPNLTVTLDNTSFQSVPSQPGSNGASYNSGTTAVSFAVTTNKLATSCIITNTVTGDSGPLQLNLNNAYSWYDTVSNPQGIAAGTYSFSVTCTAGDGGTGTTTSPISFTVKAPATTITCDPAGGATYSLSQVVTCTSSDGSPLTIFWRNPSGTLAQTTVTGTGATPAFNTPGSWSVCAENSNNSVFWPATGGCSAPAGYAIATGNNAQFVSQTAPPATMTTGQTYAVTVTMKNTGTSTWTTAAGYVLGGQNPQNTSEWGLGRAYLDPTDAIAPGQSKAFSFNVTAPATSGPYNFQWQMVQEGIEWFGALSANQAVTVTASAAPTITATQITPPSPEAAGTTGVEIAATTDINATCTVDGTAFQTGEGATSHGVFISGLTNGFNHTYSVVCAANGLSSPATPVNVTVNQPGVGTIHFSASPSAPAAYSQPVTMTVAVSGTSAAIDHTAVNETLTYLGVDGQSHTSDSFPLTCAGPATSCPFVIPENVPGAGQATFTYTDAEAYDSAGNVIAQTQTPLSVTFPGAPTLAIPTGPSYTDANTGKPVNNLAVPVGTTVNVTWTTNINADCTYASNAATGNGGTSHYVTLSALPASYDAPATISCSETKPASAPNPCTMNVNVYGVTLSGAPILLGNQNDVVDCSQYQSGEKIPTGNGAYTQVVSFSASLEALNSATAQAEVKTSVLPTIICTPANQATYPFGQVVNCTSSDSSDLTIFWRDPSGTLSQIDAPTGSGNTAAFNVAGAWSVCAQNSSNTVYWPATGGCSAPAGYAVNPSGNNAQFVSQTPPPATMTPGQTAAVSVTMKNTGTTTWTSAYSIGSLNPQDNTEWGTARVFLDATDSIAPGQSKTFNFNVTAPATPGSYNFQWKMIQKGVEWFGDQSTNQAVTVAVPPPPGGCTTDNQCASGMYCGAANTCLAVLNVASIEIGPSPAVISLHVLQGFDAVAKGPSGAVLSVSSPLNWSWTETGPCATVSAGGILHPLAAGACQISATLAGPAGAVTGVTSSTETLTIFADPTWSFYVALSSNSQTHITSARQDTSVMLVAQMTNAAASAPMDDVLFDDGVDAPLVAIPGVTGCPANAYCAALVNVSPGAYSFTAEPSRQGLAYTTTPNAISFMITPKPTVSVSLSPTNATNHYLAGSTITLTALPLNFAPGAIQTISFYLGNQLIKTVSAPPYTATYSPSGPFSWTGSFTASVHDATNGDTPSDPVIFFVDAPATLYSSPVDQYVAVGSTAGFAGAFLGSTPMTFQWQMEAPGAASFSNVGAPLTNTDISNQYITPPTALSDDGTLFRLQGSNGFGSTVTSSTAALHVSAAAVPQLSLGSATVMAGQNAAFVLRYTASAVPATTLAAEIDLPPFVTYTSATLVAVPAGTVFSTSSVTGGVIVQLRAASALAAGTVLQLNVNVSASAVAGTYPLTLSSGTLTTILGAAQSAGVADGALTIMALPPVPPVVMISAPAANATVSGVVPVTGSVTSAATLSNVQFSVDGLSVANDTSANFQFTWDAQGVTNGTHTLVVQATDFNQQAGSATVTVTVANNPLPYSTTAEVDLTVLSSTGAPVGNAQVTIANDPAFAPLAAASTDASGLLHLSFTLANSTTPISPQLVVTDPNSITVSTTVLSLQSNETRRVTVVVAQAPITPPVVTLTLPLANAILQGPAVVSGSIVVDTNTVLSSISFIVDGSTLATSAASPFQWTWDTTQISNGTHQLTVTAFDASGPSGSQSLTVQVNNPVLGTACTSSPRCGSGNYCAVNGTCEALPTATLAITTPAANMLFYVGDQTNFAAATQSDTTTLAVAQLTIRMDSTAVCSGQGAACDTSLPGATISSYTFVDGDVGAHTVLATAAIPDIQGTLITIAQSPAITVTVNAITPAVIQTLGVPAITVGDPDTSVTIGGQGFDPGMVIYANGQPLSTTDVSATRLTAILSAALFQAAGALTITATHPAWPASERSQPYSLAVVPPPHVPDLSGVPATMPVDGTINLASEAYPTVFTWSFAPVGGASGTRPAAEDGSAPVQATQSPSLALHGLGLAPGTYQLQVTETNLAGKMSAPAHTNVALVSATSSNVLVFPNPWRADQYNGKPITFRGLAQGTTVKIFTVSGRWIATVTAQSDGDATWTLTNDSGDTVQSGLYLYLASDPHGAQSHGKFAIIR